VSSKNELTEEQRLELQMLVEELTEFAKDVFDDYTNNPSELSGSITQVAEGSPLITDEI